MTMNSELIDLLRMVSSGFRARMQARIAAGQPDLTTFQARLVNAVGRNEGISQLELGTLLDRDKAQIARTVKELEARGLVKRGAHASGWRTKSVTLTPEGRSVHASLNEARRELATEALADLSDAEKHALRSGLMKMDAALRKDDLSGNPSS
jgi:DNA-binding MarR family transcriptional regulator